MYSKNRIEALSDGIFAIVMTLLVLELKVPDGIAPGQLWSVLHAQGPSWFAFIITFVIAARYWMLQHNVFALTGNFSQQAMVITFVFLGLVTVLPFYCSLIGRDALDPFAFALYCGNQTAIGVALLVKLEYLRVHDHLAKTLPMQQLRYRLYSIASIMAITGVGALFVPLRYVFVFPAVALLISHRFLPKTKAA